MIAVRERQRQDPDPPERFGVPPVDEVSPTVLFGGVDAETWRWLNLEGCEICPFLARYLPALPAEAEQVRVTPRSGQEGLELGFQIYTLFRQLYADEHGQLARDSRVLDFGCGWGRVIRFFLRDVAPGNLVGVDIDERAVSAARATNRWCRFVRSEVLPPSCFDDESFDLVYAYSVFSHLSEEAHLRWLEEFKRVLAPGGVVLLTTLGRSFIERSSTWAGDQRADFTADWQRIAGESIPDTEAAISAYDRGEYCYGAIDDEQNPHFGFACIPETYARRRWGAQFEVRRWWPNPAPRLQTMVVLRKRGGNSGR